MENTSFMRVEEVPTIMHICFLQSRQKWRISWIWKEVFRMSLKNRDEHNRWRNKTVAFRVSPEEDAQIERYCSISFFGG